MDSMHAGRRHRSPNWRGNANALTMRQVANTQRPCTYQKIIIDAPGVAHSSLVATNLATVIVGAVTLLLRIGIYGFLIVAVFMYGIIKAGRRRR